MARPESLLRVGVVLGGRYVVRELVGVGGMGVVWRGEDVHSGGYVALKEPRLDGDVNTNISKIRFEAAVLYELRHPNIVNQIEAFEVAKLPIHVTIPLRLRPVIVVLEYAGDGSLATRARYLSTSEKLEVFFKVADAVSYIHKSGVIHRDIKPHNVLFSRKEPKLSDFGTARRLRDRVVEVVESPGGYTAPEQLKGHSTEQSDIWSLGALLFYLFALRNPSEAMRGYPLSPEPPDLSLYSRDAPPNVVEAVKIAMQPRPEARFQTVDEMVEFLKRGKRVEREDLVLVVMGHELPVAEDVVLLGRHPEGRLEWGREGGVLTLYLPDRDRVVSRRHALIYRAGGRWYIKDLGSLNKTAVFRDGRWHLVYKARGEESHPFELRDGDVISICYDERLGPYLQIAVKIPE